MATKNKTVSFRIDEETFEDLRSIAENRELSLSAVFGEYVDAFVDHDGQVAVVPEHADREAAGAGDAADAGGAHPVTVEVPTSLVREHERIELECEHLRDQLSEDEAYAGRPEAELGEVEVETTPDLAWL